MAPLTCTLTANTRLTRAFIWLASVPVVFGWRYSERAEDRLACLAAKLIRVRAVPARHGATVYDPRIDPSWPRA